MVISALYIPSQVIALVKKEYYAPAFSIFLLFSGLCRIVTIYPSFSLEIQFIIYQLRKGNLKIT